MSSTRPAVPQDFSHGDVKRDCVVRAAAGRTAHDLGPHPVVDATGRDGIAELERFHRDWP